MGGYARNRLSAIARHDVRFGLDYKEYLAVLGLLDDRQIRALYPVYRIDHDFHKTLLGALNDPPEKLVAQAKQIKGEYPDLVRPLCEGARGMLKKGRSDRRTKSGPKFTSMDEVMAGYGRHKAEALYAAVARNCGPKRPTCGVEQFCDAALANPCLNRFIRLQICLAVGYCHLWEDDVLNVDVSPNRNDSTDMTVALYARDGDAIATEDKKLRAALNHTDPEKRVSVCTWDDFVGDATRQ